MRRETSGAQDDGVEEYAPEPDYFSMLPPEFSGALLKEEVIRLGGDPASMTRNEMAAMIIKAMYSAARPTA